MWLETIGVVSGCFPHVTYNYIPTALVSACFCSNILNTVLYKLCNLHGNC